MIDIKVAAFLLMPAAVLADELLAEPQSDCPVTLGTDELLESGSRNVYGSEALAVSLPSDGIWGTTRPGARIAVKLFWRSAGYRPGTESNLNVEISNLLGGPNDAVVKDVTNANAVPEDWEAARFDDDWLDGWVMLTGIDFPSPGCWQITGEYIGQSLTFVVQTVDFSNGQASSE